MNFTIQKNVLHTSIRVIGHKLDALVAPELKSVLLTVVESGEKNILADLSQCEICDTSGLSALLLGHRLCKEAKGDFVLYGLRPPVREMMELAGMDSLLKVVDTEEEAVKLFL